MSDQSAATQEPYLAGDGYPYPYALGGIGGYDVRDPAAIRAFRENQTKAMRTQRRQHAIHVAAGLGLKDPMALIDAAKQIDAYINGDEAKETA